MNQNFSEFAAFPVTFTISFGKDVNKALPQTVHKVHNVFLVFWFDYKYRNNILGTDHRCKTEFYN